MRIYLLHIILIAFAFPVNAAEDSTCAYMGKFAAKFMELRQHEVDLTDTMKLAADIAQDETHRKIYVSMVLQAYGEPVYDTPKMQRQAISRFSNRMQLICYKNYKDL
ncbi:hypothetical protein [Allorhizobium terrae]|uniref:DUF1311 domain-containing protein n=1 Tax=Allorhizobium terrae TaxID=1848972 RepID=A0A4S4A5A5_9HYPH|nr:hypothetical protein [Allorhizobium terrae]THF53700.1 hypothetical protein E6C51_00845 [Allorhizobium terrae]